MPKVVPQSQTQIDTTSPDGRFVFNLLASLAEFERELIAERTKAGLSAARARGRNSGRPRKLYSYVNGDGSPKKLGADLLVIEM